MLALNGGTQWYLNKCLLEQWENSVFTDVKELLFLNFF